MKQRPRSVTFISWLFVAAGVIGTAYHGSEFASQRPMEFELAWVLFLRLLAIVCGVLMLRGSNSARWAAIGWTAYHVVLSVFHSLAELVMHIVIFVGVAFVLLRANASAYFRGAGGHTEQAGG
jgi:hypothetical protein